MAEDYQVQEGECVNSISYDRGFFWQTLWNHPKNAGLQSIRKDGNILMPGDLVHIPDLEIKKVPGATEQKHKFRLKGVPARFFLTLMELGKPRANLAYRLIIDGKTYSGQTDAQGQLKVSISPSARQGKLILGDKGEVYQLDLGSLDPIDTPSGILARLKSLGYFSGEQTEDEDGGLAAALKAFQAAKNLSVTGEADDSTKGKLKSLYGC